MDAAHSPGALAGGPWASPGGLWVSRSPLSDFTRAVDISQELSKLGGDDDRAFDQHGQQAESMVRCMPRVH
jgi:hypothetical protein